MSTPITLSLVSAAFSCALLLAYIRFHRRFIVRMSLIFMILSVMTTMFDVGMIRAYTPDPRPIHMAPAQMLR